jgi:hypothetical protein
VDLQPILDVLGCPVAVFPIKYLGLPLSVHRLSKADLQPLVDKMARSVPAWSAALLKKSGRLIYINAKLAASPLYHMLSLDLPPWFFNVCNKLLRGFFWSATLQAQRGHCVVAWDRICEPKEIGGLGIKNLRILNHALRMRWRWFQLTDQEKPWAGLEFKLDEEAERMFKSCTTFEVGNGQKLLFWTDRWLQGCSIEDMAPNLMKFVRPRARTMTVAAAMHGNEWIAQIRGAPSIPAIAEFVDVWTALGTVNLGTEEVRITWKLTDSRVYTAKSAYSAFFLGRIQDTAASHLWSAGAPLIHKLHTWFSLKDRLWTADRLERRGLDHPAMCVLCFQEPETSAHIATTCSFSRQIWYEILLGFRLHRFTPTVDGEFALWWNKMAMAVP